jgi:hypothetical protein
VEGGAMLIETDRQLVNAGKKMHGR